MYLRLFHDLWDSSLMASSVPVRWLFITMLSMADKARSGQVDVPLFILARQAGMTEDETREALKVLLEPDPFSRSDRAMGRRLILLRPDQPERGWEIVNWDVYSKQFRAEDRRKQTAEAVARYRAKVKAAQEQGVIGSKPEVSTSNPEPLPSKPDVSVESNVNQNVSKKHKCGMVSVELGSPVVLPVELSTEVGAPEKKPRGSSRFTPPTIDEVAAHAQGLGWFGFDAEHFHAHHETRGWKLKGGVLMTSWRAAMVTWRKNDGAFERTSTTPAPKIQLPTERKPPRKHLVKFFQESGNCKFDGKFFSPVRGGKQWYAEDGARPDRTDKGADPKNQALNEEVYAEMRKASGITLPEAPAPSGATIDPEDAPGPHEPSSGPTEPPSAEPASSAASAPRQIELLIEKLEGVLQDAENEGNTAIKARVSLRLGLLRDELAAAQQATEGPPE